jgi:hypothetical protein
MKLGGEGRTGYEVDQTNPDVRQTTREPTHNTHITSRMRHQPPVRLALVLHGWPVFLFVCSCGLGSSSRPDWPTPTRGIRREGPKDGRGGEVGRGMTREGGGRCVSSALPCPGAAHRCFLDSSTVMQWDATTININPASWDWDQALPYHGTPTRHQSWSQPTQRSHPRRRPPQLQSGPVPCPCPPSRLTLGTTLSLGPIGTSTCRPLPLLPYLRTVVLSLGPHCIVAVQAVVSDKSRPRGLLHQGHLGRQARPHEVRQACRVSSGVTTHIEQRTNTRVTSPSCWTGRPTPTRSAPLIHSSDHPSPMPPAHACLPGSGSKSAFEECCAAYSGHPLL